MYVCTFSAEKLCMDKSLKIEAIKEKALICVSFFILHRFEIYDTKNLKN